jgi:hypothetical protein
MRDKGGGEWKYGKVEGWKNGYFNVSTFQSFNISTPKVQRFNCLFIKKAIGYTDSSEWV